MAALTTSVTVADLQPNQRVSNCGIGTLWGTKVAKSGKPHIFQYSSWKLLSAWRSA
jgi:hypothetical protein